MKSLRQVFCIIGMLVLGNQSLALTTQQTDHVFLLAQSWATGKNLHSGACGVDWDGIWIESVDDVIAASDDAAFNSILFEMMSQLGPTVISNNELPASDDWYAQQQDENWLQDARLSQQNRLYLKQLISAFRPRENCFVSSGLVGKGDYSADSKYHNLSALNAAQRLLGLVRFWNIIKQYYPYKHLMDDPWDITFKSFIPLIHEASSYAQYHQQMRIFTAQTKDTHTYFYSPYFNPYFTQAYLPFVLKTVEGQLIVTKESPSKPQVELGDQLLSVDGRSVDQVISELSLLTSASNPTTLTDQTDQLINRGEGEVELKFEKSNGEVYDTTVRYGMQPAHPFQSRYPK